MLENRAGESCDGGASVASVRDLRRRVRGAVPTVRQPSEGDTIAAHEPAAPREQSEPSPRALRPHNAAESSYESRPVDPAVPVDLTDAGQRMFWWKNLRSVLRLQRWVRRSLAKRDVGRWAQDRREALDAEYRCEAAEMIQRAWRRHHGNGR